MNHKKMILVIDESGAKGYSKTNEKCKEEIGVMAGFLYSPEEVEEIKQCMDQMIGPRENKKIHITDSGSSDKLREKVFLLMKKSKIRWFYQAIYVEGLYQSEFDDNRGGTCDPKKLLHSELFQGMLIMAISLATQLDIKYLDLQVLTDNIDKGVLNQFNKTKEDVQALYLEKTSKIYKSKNEYAFVTTQITSNDSPAIEDLDINIVCDQNSSLTIMADVLANSVRYYLNKAVTENDEEKEYSLFLNNKQALKKHPLVDLVIAAENGQSFLSILDLVFRRMKK